MLIKKNDGTECSPFKNRNIPKNRDKEKYNDDMIKILKMGSDMIKYKSNGRKYKRHFYLDLDELTLRYSGSKKFCRTKKIVEIPEIREIRNGPNTETFRSLANRVKDSLAFSLVIGNKYDTLDLVAKTPEIKEQWVSALKHVISLYKNMEQEKEHEKWAIDHFNRADINKDGGLSFEETLQLLNHMNINMDKRYAKKLFDASDINTKKNKTNEDVLDQQEFLNFYKLLIRRPEIVDIIRQYSKTGSSYLEPKELLDFMHKEQKQLEVTLENCETLIKTYEKTTKEGTIGVEGMRCMLVSRDQALFNKNHLEVYQDMTKPLTDYYINSSHNTYLGGDQIVGPCSVENYIKVLRSGCRCVEIDIWDGQDGDPVVYHGHTLTPKIKFIDVLTAISDYAFEISSFPLILSLENHCSIEQQKLMAYYLKTILGEKIYVARIKGDDLIPSPLHLKERYLLKGKKMDQPDQLIEVVSEEDEAAEIEDDIVQKDTHSKPQSSHNTIKLAKELSDLIYLRSTHFSGFNDPGKSNCIRSFDESRALALINEDKNSFIQYHKKHLSRIYPSGMRTDSSNFDPMAFWKAGCQIVAVNFQHVGKKLQIYQAKFKDNGSCGYVLKPDYLLSDYDGKTAQAMELRPKLLKIKIISAQQLPKPMLNAKEKDVVDPYVKIDIIGLEHTQKSKTRIIENNGFNPIWNESFDFVIEDPQSAIVRLVVKDYDSSSQDDFIGQYTIPFNSLMEGYHHSHLKNKKSDSIPPATLFIHTVIEDYKDNFISLSSSTNQNQASPSTSFHTSKTLSVLKSRSLPLEVDPEETNDNSHFVNNNSSAPLSKLSIYLDFASLKTTRALSFDTYSCNNTNNNNTNVQNTPPIIKSSTVSLLKEELKLTTASITETTTSPSKITIWPLPPHHLDLFSSTNTTNTRKISSLGTLKSLELLPIWSISNNPYKPLSPAKLPNGSSIIMSSPPSLSSSIISQSQTEMININNIMGPVPVECVCHKIVKAKIKKYPPNTVYYAPLILDTSASSSAAHREKQRLCDSLDNVNSNFITRPTILNASKSWTPSRPIVIHDIIKETVGCLSSIFPYSKFDVKTYCSRSHDEFSSASTHENFISNKDGSYNKITPGQFLNDGPKRHIIPPTWQPFNYYLEPPGRKLNHRYLYLHGEKGNLSNQYSCCCCCLHSSPMTVSGPCLMSHLLSPSISSSGTNFYRIPHHFSRSYWQELIYDI